MSFISTRTPTASVAFDRRPRRPSLLARLLARIAQEIRIRRDLRSLAALDDGALHDIGLGRGGIEDAVRNGRSHRGNRSAFDLVRSPLPVTIVPPPAWTEWR